MKDCTRELNSVNKKISSGEWIRTIGLRVMSPSGSPGYPTPLHILRVTMYSHSTVSLQINVAMEEAVKTYIKRDLKYEIFICPEGKVLIMLLLAKFKSYGKGETGYMGHTGYKMPMVSVSSPWHICFWDSLGWQVEIGRSPLPPKSFWKVLLLQCSNERH